MVIPKHRRVGSLLLLLTSLGWAVACVSGGADGGNSAGPECYANQYCSNGRECSMGVCVGYVGGCANPGGTICRNNEDCLDNVCRLKCDTSSDCEGEGLICGEDTQHCKPGQNPTRPQSQPQSGSGGTTSSGTGGSGSTASTGGTAGHATGAGAPGTSTGSAGMTSGTPSAGAPGAGGAASAAAGRPGSSGGAPSFMMGAPAGGRGLGIGGAG